MIITKENACVLLNFLEVFDVSERELTCILQSCSERSLLTLFDRLKDARANIGTQIGTKRKWDDEIDFNAKKQKIAPSLKRKLSGENDENALKKAIYYFKGTYGLEDLRDITLKLNLERRIVILKLDDELKSLFERSALTSLSTIRGITREKDYDRLVKETGTSRFKMIFSLEYMKNELYQIVKNWREGLELIKSLYEQSIRIE